MKKNIKLLLLAALAWPGIAMAQGQIMPLQSAQKSEGKVATAESVVSQHTLPLETSAAPSPKLEGGKKIVVPQVNQFQTTTPETATVKVADARNLVANYDHDSSAGATIHKAPRRAEALTPPSSIIENAEEWYISTNFYNNGASGFIEFNNTIKVAIDGDDIYVQGLCLWLPDAWVHGTINGNEATFTSGQFFGTFTQSDADYEIYFVGFDTYLERVCDVTFSYNATAHKLTLQDDLEIYMGANTTDSYYAYHINTVIAKEYVMPAVPVEVANGTDANARIPVYGTRYGYSTTSQMIYPASMLTNFEDGQQIKSVTFYTNNDGIKFSGGQITVTIGTTDQTYFTGNTALTISGTTATATVVPVQNSTSMKVEFSNPLVYTAGSNIIIQMMNTTTGTAGATNWMGVQYSSGEGTYYSYTSRGYTPSGTYPYFDEARRFRYMPKATFELRYPPMLTDELDFGSVKVGQSKTMKAFVENAANEVVSATVITSAPFSVTSPVELQPGVNEVSVTFTPTDAVNYNGTMTIHVNGTDIVISLKATGQEDGPLAIRNKEFFEGITYKWTDDNGNIHRSNLSEVATDPNQIIAMLRKVYVDKTIPGNYHRGFTSTGGTDHDEAVNYSAVGSLKSASTALSAFDDTYGWNIKPESGDILRYNNYYYLNPNQFKPNNEGVTLLLLEMVDDFTPTSTGGDPTHDYSKLRDYFAAAIKSARVVTEATRVGDKADYSSGTLFKIDCDKMNKFYLIAKGQLGWFKQRSSNTSYDFSYPFYYNQWLDYGLQKSYLDVEPAFLCHMFEQLSPAEGNSESPLEDGYRMFVTEMKSFGIDHDCPNVPFVKRGHHFMMYGQESAAADCQDIRDMMFLVPDYRMMDWNGRGNTSKTQDYFNYIKDHQPSIGVFVIHQDEIPAGTKISSNEGTVTEPAQLKGLYKHQLKWYSNLGDFLPGDEQYYELWELVVDEFGKESYVPVYYRNANGKYRVEQNDQVTWVSDTAGLSQYLVPIVLSRNSAATVTETVNDKQVTKLLYTDVYVDMMAGSQTKTYVVRGRDSENFLSLQMSNQQEIVIPGLDPNEKVRLIGATYYSRYNPDNEKNCYSNKLEMKNNATGLTRSDVTGKVIKFYRSSRAALVDDEGNVVTDAQGNIQYVGDEQVEKFPFATGTINGSNLDITLAGPALENEFPVGASDFEHGDLRYAGYHANGSLSFPFIEKTDGTLDFGNLVFWDNFTVDVSKNKHPLQYLYRMEVADANENVDSYSNNVRVPVYKTASRINPPLTKDEVDGDAGHNPDYSPGDVEFGAQVQLSSKTEILRYDAYRWDENTTKRFIVDEVYNNDTEQDLPPDGMAGNQGDFYTVSMNDVNDPRYYYAATGSDQPAVTTGQPLNWATFVDYKPMKLAEDGNAASYVYAPVVELFTKGYNATNSNLARKDYNTYGGPMQKSAVGKVDGEIVKVSNGGEETGYETSSMTWEQNDKTYCYYNLPVSIDVLDLPANYEVYKIRAWRQIDPELLGECPQSAGPNVPDRSDRISGDYLFEELNFGDDMYNDPEAQTVRNVSAASLLHYYLGDRLSTREDAQRNERMATFGAVKLGEGESMDVKIIVRVYFTKGNGEENGNSQHGPRRVLTPENLSADGKYYVAEKVVTTKIQGSGIVTDLDNLKASREVMDVNYVNTMGQVANRPWQGVNVVVTRYTDGTTKTTKAVY